MRLHQCFSLWFLLGFGYLGITLYANGKSIGALALDGRVTFAPDVELRIGTNHQLMKPSNIHREHGTVESFWCLDGALDELKLYNRALAPKEVAMALANVTPVADCEIQPRRMPSGPKGPGRFGAIYCKLKYYEQWDALWRVDDHPDVLVRFDQTPVRVVFWRGSRYSPAWVTDKDQWMADQRYNFRSSYDPVIIYEPGNRMHYVKDRDIRGYERPGACNHWPVGQARCDGRTVQADDRPTHFLGFPISAPPVHVHEDRSWWNGIYGMTDLPMETMILQPVR